MMKETDELAFEFRPITLQTNASNRLSSKDSKVHEYHKLIKVSSPSCRWNDC